MEEGPVTEFRCPTCNDIILVDLFDEGVDEMEFNTKVARHVKEHHDLEAMLDG